MSDPRLARELVPDRYAVLPMVRVFLPVRDENDDCHRWSDFLSGGLELTGSLSWWQVWDRYVTEHGEARPEFTPARGRLDEPTAAALRDALALRLDPTAPLLCHRWDGYGDIGAPESSARKHHDGHTFIEFTSTVDRVLDSTTALPEFACDRDGFVAWGTNLYPDSLVIASESAIYRSLINDSRVDTATIRKTTDIFPVSSGD